MLTVDLGNSRAKLRRWSADGARCTARLDLAGDDLAPLAGWFAERVELGALSSVAAGERTAALRRALAPFVVELVLAPPSGLENRCRPPESVGQDRLYAAAGAAARLARSCVVVDAGTALTVDALRVEGERGIFLGGAIAPGPALLSEALAAGTARLPRVEPVSGAPALGTDTAAALRAGIGVGLRGAARELVEEVARAAGLGAAPVVLTGGARAFLLEPAPFTARPLTVDEELVHRGLVAALARRRGAARP